MLATQANQDRWATSLRCKVCAATENAAKAVQPCGLAANSYEGPGHVVFKRKPTAYLSVRKNLPSRKAQQS